MFLVCTDGVGLSRHTTRSSGPPLAPHASAASMKLEAGGDALCAPTGGDVGLPPGDRVSHTQS